MNTYSSEKAQELHIKAFSAALDYMLDSQNHSASYDVLRYARKGFYTDVSGETQYGLGSTAYKLLRAVKAGDIIVKEAYEIEKLSVVMS